MNRLSGYIDCGKYLCGWVCRVEAPEEVALDGAMRAVASLLSSGNKNVKDLKAALNGFDARVYFGSPMYYHSISDIIDIQELV